MSVAGKSATKAAITLIAAGSTLVNNSNALSSAQDPTSAAYGGDGTNPGYQFGQFYFTTGATALTAAPTANGSIDIYYLYPGDGTLTGTPGSYGTDLGRSATPIGPKRASITLDSTNTTQIYNSGVVRIPVVPFKVIMVNAATGQTLPATYTLTIVPIGDTGV